MSGCGLIVIDNPDSVDVSMLNDLIEKDTNQYLVLLESSNCSYEFLEQALKVLSTSRRVKIVADLSAPCSICFSKEAWTLLGGWDSDLNKNGLTAALVEKANKFRFFSQVTFHRRIGMLSTVVPLDSRAQLSELHGQIELSAPTTLNIRQLDIPMTFASLGINFEAGGNVAMVKADQSLWDNEKAMPMLDQAIKLLNADQPLPALELLDQLIEVRRDMAYIMLFPRAIAEIKLGRYLDAIHSLIATIERTPDHAEARNLLAQLQNAVR